MLKRSWHTFAHSYYSVLSCRILEFQFLPDSGLNSISGSWQEATCSYGAAARRAGRAHIYDTRTGRGDIFVSVCVCVRVCARILSHALSRAHRLSASVARAEGSLCWAGWDVRMNQCESSWLDMPIHLPKKRERKGGRARDSERNELNPGAKCLAICITLQVLLSGRVEGWSESCLWKPLNTWQLVDTCRSDKYFDA